VHADYASFRLTDCLFTRIGMDDSLASNASSFMLEMKEMSYILQNVSNESLIIIDELGRGTCLTEGLSLCVAICEQLVNTQAYVFLATHFKELSMHLKMYPNVYNMHLKVNVMTDSMHHLARIKFDYVAEEGVCTEENYGLVIAQVAGFASDILLRAHDISRQLKEDLENLELDKSDKTKRAEYQFFTRCVKAKQAWTGDDYGLKMYLKGLYHDFVNA
jgi:DNA mismatch repair protein MSH4